MSNETTTTDRPGYVTADQLVQAYKAAEDGAPWGVVIKPNDQDEIRTNPTSGARYRRLLDAFAMEATRYPVDGWLIWGKAPGWKQYDCDQDAPYFGTWVNVHTWQEIVYAEGDLSLIQYETAEDMKKALLHMAEFYGTAPPAFIIYDDQGNRTDIFDQRPTPEEVEA